MKILLTVHSINFGRLHFEYHSGHTWVYSMRRKQIFRNEHRRKSDCHCEFLFECGKHFTLNMQYSSTLCG